MSIDSFTNISGLLQVGTDGTLSSGTNAFMPNTTYQAAQFSNQYDVTGLSYPEDLMDNPAYGQNRVIFYINVSVDSRVLRNGTSEVAVVEGVQRDMRSQLLGQKVSTQNVATATGVTGAVAGYLGGKFGAGAGLAGAVVGGAFGVGGTALIESQANTEAPEGQKKEPTFTRPQKRLKSAVALYIPNQLNARYSVGWGEEDTFMFSALTKGGEELVRALESKGAEGRPTGIAAEVLTAAGVGGDIGLPFGKEQGVAAGLAQNPKKEQAFKNVDFRTFTFEYQFAPKSSTEAKNVLNIIKAFKYHMHPEFKSEDAFLYIYPSEFDIVYYKGAEENLNIHRHTSCVLTEMNVNYTPNGVFTTFPDGMPTQINLTLTFKELMLLSKETIEKYT